MTRRRATLNAATLFSGVCLMLGTPGALVIEAMELLAIYGVGVLGFAAWVSRDAYLRHQ
ncbi:hypothetical protein [Microvirga sp. M2]|uniref:hypothetical protein n=1 Tax=Microvirga sp. M2 TaxID=3073270 RepID=UPI0039C073DB